MARSVARKTRGGASDGSVQGWEAPLFTERESFIHDIQNTRESHE